MLRNVLQHAKVRYQICNFAILKKKNALLKLNFFVSFYNKVKNFLNYIEFSSKLEIIFI